MSSEFIKLANDFESALRNRASRCDWLLTANRALLRDSSASIDDLLSETSETRPLPEFRRAFDLQPASLSLLLCALDETLDSYRAALWWAGLIRSEIPPSKRSDLHLFLIAPRGTYDSSLWRGRRSRIESDERFCRKFVWLPSNDPTAQEIDAFFDRTFLAQPWAGETAEPSWLDPLERLIEEIDLDSLLDSVEAVEWVKTLSALESAKGQIAEELVAILERHE